MTTRVLRLAVSLGLKSLIHLPVAKPRAERNVGNIWWICHEFVYSVLR